MAAIATFVAAAGALRKHRAAKPEASFEEDPEEAELRSFEKNCQLLNTKQYKGLRRVQVELWLLFEDQTSSSAAMFTQGLIFFLIIFSTALILVQSTGQCKYVLGDQLPSALAYGDLVACTNYTSASVAEQGCTRVCLEKKDPFEPGGPIHYFVMDAVCMSVFTLEFLLRMLASPAAIGLGAFWCDVQNWIDLIAILPFYLDLVMLAAGAPPADSPLGVLRIVRLSRIVRVLKFSKSISSFIVLGRTIFKSISAMVLIVVFSLIMCIFGSSVMMAMAPLDVGRPFYVDSGEAFNLSLSGRPNGVEYVRKDGTPSFFSMMFENWWWCFQTLTSEGYGVPWVPDSDAGKVIAIVTAMAGTVVLALPIAVVGVTFDDEWVKQAKIDRFATESCVLEYNALTRTGTRAVPAQHKPAQWGRSTKRVTPYPSGPSAPPAGCDAAAKTVGGASEAAASAVDKPAAAAAVSWTRGGAAAQQSSAAEIAEALSSRGTLFSAGSHQANQAYNVQTDLHTLVDQHFRTARQRTRIILDEQREKLCRSLNTDLKAALRANQLSTNAMDAFKRKLAARRGSTASSSPKMDHSSVCARILALRGSKGFAGVVAKAAMADEMGKAAGATSAWGATASSTPSSAKPPRPPEVERSAVALITPRESAVDGDGDGDGDGGGSGAPAATANGVDSQVGSDLAVVGIDSHEESPRGSPVPEQEGEEAPTPAA
jgi:hypothetical protein